MANRSTANSAGAARCVAVDLGPRHVRVVEIEQAGAESRIVRRASAALPANCWNDVSSNRDAMAASIREALATAGITTKSVVACLPRRLVTVRFARLPQAPPEQIRGMIEFEAQQYILFPLNEVILDYHVPTGIGGGMTGAQDDMQTVLLAAARRSLVTDIVSIFDRIGIELSQLSVSALALAEHIRGSLEPTAVIALESGAMDVSVVADGQLLFTRSSAIEVAGIAKDVAARKFSEEVARSFTAYQNEFRQKPLVHVFLCGSETATPEGDWMDQALIEALEKPVDRLHSRLLPGSDPEARSYATATGMALQALGGALSDINLVPNERAEKRLQTQRARKRQLVGLAVAAAVVGGVFYLKSALDAQEVRLKETKAANDVLEKALKDEKPVQRSHDRVTALDRVLDKALDRDHLSIDVLVALNRCLPKSTDIWLTQLNFDRGGLMTIRGDSKNSRAVTNLLLNLQTSGAFTDVKLSYLADAQDTATNTDVVRNTAPKPPVTPLPGLQPNPAAAVPGAAPGAPGGPAVPGANPAAGAPAGFNPGAGGFNPAGGGNNFFPGGNGFRNGRGGFRGGFGGQGGFTPGTGTLITSTPGSFVAGGQPANVAAPSTPVNTAVPVQTLPAATPDANAAALPAAGPGQITYTPTQAPTQPAPAAPAAPSFTVGGQGTPGLQPPGAAGPPGGGRLGFGPGGGGGRGSFTPEQIEAFRQAYRNRITGGGGPSSVNMGGGLPGTSQPGGAIPGRGAPGAPTPGAPVPGGPGATVPTTVKPAAPAHKPAAPIKKPTLTGFVITCRLRPDAKLIPPNALDAVHKDSAPTHTKTAEPKVEGESEADTSDDTGDIE